MTKTIAYLRVSTNSQDLEKNRSAILHLANEKNLGKVDFVEETVSGRVSWRKRKIAAILEELNNGDRIIVSELSRLGRSMLECMEILAIATEKCINIYAVKGNWQLDGSMQSTPDLDSMEAKLARYGYNIQALCELLNTRSSDVKAYLSGQLNDSSKLSEFNKEIYKLGVI